MPTPGTVLQNRYRIVKLIGKGGMGAVYEAEDERLDCLVAVKQILPEYLSHDDLRRAFEREAKLLARLDHPALPHVGDHFADAAGQFLVMKFIAGENLLERLKRNGGSFPVEHVLQWADVLLDALEYLHGCNPPVVHRDVKPANLKLTEKGAFFLLDFGAAKGLPLHDSDTTGSLQTHSLGYSPPEQIHRMGTNARSDLYSVGATLYHLLTGAKPTDAGIRSGNVLTGNPDPLRPAAEVRSGIPQAVSTIIHQAMALKSDHRPATATHLRRMLREATATAPNRRVIQIDLSPTMPAVVSDLGPTAPAPTQPGQPATLPPTEIVPPVVLPKTVTNRVGMELVLIPKGRFEMGSTQADEERWNKLLAKYLFSVNFEAERPRHLVSISRPFYLGKYPVTMGEYLEFCRETKSHWPVWLEEGSRYHVRTGSDEYYKAFVSAGAFRQFAGGVLKGKDENDRRPVVGVSWNDARAFCGWLSKAEGREYRLPSEAEWEYACRAGKAGDYAGELDEMGWYGNNSGRKPIDVFEAWKKSGTDWTTYWNDHLKPNGNRPHPVGQKDPNDFGLHDMHGNVWEWCEDAWHDNYNGAPTDGSAWVLGGDQGSRVLRGGSWSGNSDSCRSAGRFYSSSDNRSDSGGFRVMVAPRTQ